MPNREVHVVSSAVVGALVALDKSRGQADSERLCEVLGAVGGGALGGRLPDILEPPITPRHRGTAHSAVALGTVIRFCQVDLDRLQGKCRQWADGFRAKRLAATPGSLDAIAFQIAELACRCLAGFIAGVLSGYITHVLLDACTPSCICIV